MTKTPQQAAFDGLAQSLLASPRNHWLVGDRARKVELVAGAGALHSDEVKTILSWLSHGMSADVLRVHARVAELFPLAIRGSFPYVVGSSLLPVARRISLQDRKYLLDRVADAMKEDPCPGWKASAGKVCARALELLPEYLAQIQVPGPAPVPQVMETPQAQAVAKALDSVAVALARLAEALRQ
jgi:hypothetical protein